MDPVRQNPIWLTCKPPQRMCNNRMLHITTIKSSLLMFPLRPTSLIRSGHGGWGMMQFYVVHSLIWWRRENLNMGAQLQIMRFWYLIHLISSLATRGHQKFGRKCPYLGKLFIILSLIELKQPNLVDLCRLRMCINPENFVRIHSGAIILVKFEIFSFVGRKPIPWTGQGEIWQVTLVPAKFHLDRCKLSGTRW